MAPSLAVPLKSGGICDVVPSTVVVSCSIQMHSILEAQ